MFPALGPVILGLVGTGIYAIAAAKKGDSAPSLPGTGIATPTSTTTSQSGGVWSGLSTAQQSKIASVLQSLGVDPSTGNISPGAANQESIAAATALASELERAGATQAAAILRAYTQTAASGVQVQTPTAFQGLPAELAESMTRVLALESDPKKIRAFIVKLRPYSSIPAVQAAITALEAKAVKLENQADAADTLEQIDSIQKDGIDTTASKESPGMSAAMQSVLSSVLAGMGVDSNGNITITPTAESISKAEQAVEMLKKAGHVSEANQLAALIAKAKKARAAAGATQTVPTVVTTPTSSYSVPATYRVQAGDYPAKVAKKFTGDSSRWTELQKENPQYNFLKRFDTKMVLKIPQSWRTGTAVSGEYCDCQLEPEVGCWVSGLDPKKPTLQIQYERQGSHLLAHAYYVKNNGQVEIATVRVDVRPLLKLVQSGHRKLHRHAPRRRIGAVSASASFRASASLGLPKRKRHKKRFLGKFAKKLAKIKLFQKIGRVFDPRRRSAARGVGLAVTAAVMPAVGIPALLAYRRANRICSALEKPKKQPRKRRFRLRGKGRVRIRIRSRFLMKIKKLGLRFKRRRRRVYLARARRKGLFEKYGQHRVYNAVEVASRQDAKKKLVQLAKKRPQIRRRLIKAQQEIRRRQQPKRALPVQPIQRKVKRMVQKARAGDPKAKREVSILAIVARHRKRVAHRGHAVPEGPKPRQKMTVQNRRVVSVHHKEVPPSHQVMRMQNPQRPVQHSTQHRAVRQQPGQSGTRQMW